MVSLPADDALVAALQPALPGFLAERRWFAGKGRTLVATIVEDLARLPASGAGGDVVLVVARAEYADGFTERYALLVATVADPGDLPVIATLPSERGGPSIVVEAAGSPFAIAALVDGFAAPAGSGPASVTTRGGGRLEYADASAGAVAAADLTLAGIRPLGVEQSNSSVRVGARLLFKLFRVLAYGENPEVEIGRALGAAGFRATPALCGSITHRPPAGEPSTIAVLQAWRDNAGDGWTHVVAALRALQQDSGDVATLRHDAAVLGATTAEMHAALACAGTEGRFVPEPAGTGDVAGWTAAVATRAATLATRLAAAGTLADGTRALLADVGDVAAAARALGAAPALAISPSFAKIRIHGDYHLGQTLRVSDGFLVIDFEGEPSRPLAERRAKHCALKDVAGMLRSFAYAVAVAGEGVVHGPGSAADEMRDELEAALRGAFLAGYFTRAADAAFLPADEDARRALLDLFELEKALYEVEYELDHRPAWTHIPLRGVARLCRSGSRRA